MFLETENGNYLLDAGQKMSIMNNSLELKKDLSTLEGLVISHHHFDHTGVVEKVLNVTRDIIVYIHSGFFEESHYVSDDNSVSKVDNALVKNNVNDDQSVVFKSEKV